MKKVLFIDRDGTLILEPPDEQIDSLEKLEYLPGVFTWLGKIARETDYELVIITNQDGLGTDRFPENTFWPAHERMMKTFENEGIKFSNVLIDKSFPHENLNTRKPGTGLLTEYLSGKYD
jgi:imidazoleglycerol-phosphate dehydratase / histidinol-phosphatase